VWKTCFAKDVFRADRCSIDELRFEYQEDEEQECSQSVPLYLSFW